MIMIKKITVFFVSLVMCLALAACSDEYVMTAEDLAIQEAMVGYWTADDSTGLNSYNAEGELIGAVIVEFTDDFNYLIHLCDVETGYVTTYPPVKYSIEDELFKVIEDGAAYYAKVRVNSDEKKLYWITDEETLVYFETSEEIVKLFGIPEYNPDEWVDGTDTVTEIPESVTVSESEAPSETTNNGEQTVSPSGYVLDPTVKFSADADFTNNAVLIAETDNIRIYGIYPDGAKPMVIIEHDDVIDEFEQSWITPQNSPPAAEYTDIDGDGEKELICSYHIGSGTGLNVHELVVYRKNADGHFDEYRFDAEAEIDEKVNFVISNNNHWLDFAAYGTNEIYSVSTAKDYPDGIDEISFGRIVSFELSDGGIELHTVPCASVLRYECMPEIVADVTFDGGNFDLENIDFRDFE